MGATSRFRGPLAYQSTGVPHAEYYVASLAHSPNLGELRERDYSDNHVTEDAITRRWIRLVFPTFCAGGSDPHYTDHGAGLYITDHGERVLTLVIQ